ncbi:MAG: S8 family serine peptidase [Candidatus Sericytochromatia bacterium]|nr:S8 family serine peptidase [Candidatus Sericytochromatia bacterium]
MNQSLRVYLIWFLVLAITACQMSPPGTGSQATSAGGFQILGRGKPELKPLLSCVSQNRDGSLLAHFSYENTLGKTMTLPVGEQNKFLENPGWGNNHQKHEKDERDEKDRRNEKDHHSQNEKNHGFSVQSKNQNEHQASHNPNSQSHFEKENKEHRSNRRDYQDRGQITVFPPGAGPGWPQSAFSVAFTQERLTWQLGKHSVTAYARDLSQRCKEENLTVAEHTIPRKTLLPAQTVTLTQTQQVFNFSFQAAETSDLRRRIVINLLNGPNSSIRVNNLNIFINKQPLIQQLPNASFLKAEIPDMIAEIYNAQFGQNNIELQISGPIGAKVQFNIEGFMRAALIEKAAHSAIPDNELIRKTPIYKGILTIKFMEGMKVRLKESNKQYERLFDETGVSLLPLNTILAYHQITNIARALPGSVEELNEMEQLTEAQTGHEAPNQNLFYDLYFDQNKDVWEMIDRLSSLPFIEEAFPAFIYSYPQSSPTPLPYFQPEEMLPGKELSLSVPNLKPTPVPYTKWLHCTRILNQNAGLPADCANPPTSPQGAWDRTRGEPGVKIAILEHGYNRNHEDLSNIQQIVNVEVPPGDRDWQHATQTLGVVGATQNNSSKPPIGQGAVGVAHKTSVLHIQMHAKGFSAPSKCLGAKGVNPPESVCQDNVIDSLLLAKQSGVKVIMVEAAAQGINPGTLETLAPKARAIISQNLLLAGISVILPAGNRACEDISDSTDFDLCKKIYNFGSTDPLKKPGKDIRVDSIAETYYSWPQCIEPNLLMDYLPPTGIFGVIIAATKQMTYFNCLNTTKVVKNIRFKSEKRMSDTGSIIVGALKVDGGGMVAPNSSGKSILPYNYGKSNADVHGTDISAPGHFIHTTIYHDSQPGNNSAYHNSYGGTSAAASVIAGVVALMLSVNPTLTPQNIRKILRETQQPLPSGEDISGMVNAYEAVKAAQSLPGGFKTASLRSPPPGTTPESAGVNALYDPQNTNPISARAGDVIGFFTDAVGTSNISIEIQGKNAVISTTQADFFTVTVPADLLVGLAHFTFKSDEGEFTIENLINYTSPYPEVVKWSKPTIFANGGDIVDGYITVKDANGQPAPDGTPYYVQLVPTQLGLYPDLTMIHPETGQQYGGRWTTVEQVLPVKNGKIHIQAKLNAPIAPYEYTYDFNNNLPNVFTWPHANAPSFQVQVCNPAYDSGRPGYGYYCGQQLFPQAGNTLDGRLYAIHAYSFDPQIHQVTGGSPKRTITIRNIKDILGNPVPVGTVLHFNQTYYGNVSNPNGNDIYWGVAVTTPGEVEVDYEPFQRFYCGSVGLEEVIYMTSVQGAANNSLYWLVGNPIYFRYVACQ